MTTEASPGPHTNENIYTPPTLPTHLSGIYILKPIVGRPSSQDVKEIHAAIRAVNAEAQIPHLYNPDLSLELSQHLFNVQLAIHRSTYPLSLFPGEHTYTPPSLPAHIPIILEPVVGSPSKEQLKAVQNAMRVADSLGSSPLFDTDLNMDLSQHLFNLQFARFLQSSTLGQYTSKCTEPRSISENVQGSQVNPPEEDPRSVNSHSVQSSLLGTQVAASSAFDESRRLESAGITQLRESLSAIKDLMNESKGVLENINRVMIATQRTQSVIGIGNTTHYGHVNPVNDQGITAVECGLPQLNYSLRDYNQYMTGYLLNTSQIAGYLRFFNIGADLIEGDQEPKVKDGKRDEAERLIYKHIGLLQ